MRAGDPPTYDLFAGPRAAAEPALRSLLASHAATAMLASVPLVPVLGGLSNLCWRADAGERSYFIRLARQATEDLGADHANESRVLVLAGAAGLAPCIVHSDDAARLLVTDWIHGSDSSPPLPRARASVAVALALAKLHHIPVPQDLRIVDFDRQARELGNALPPLARFRDLADVAADVSGLLQAGTARQALCHHDLNPLNLLFDRDGRLWLVDWEYAGLGDPVFDLASYASQHGLDARQRARFATSYAAAGGGAVEVTRLEQATWAFDYVQWLWYRAAMQGRGNLADRNLAQARMTWLAASLRKRARRLLRCNNEPFADNEPWV
jgi:thiamine kinase-like enzyme